ncbi:hypothetical protein G7075_10300 [Phycicoccus sp. HDW14]|uniref:hypothetical protein n=1 Tax=Phycicoccus sp. HDW14 TaxID=2714941 RepID=UPI00140D5ADD|nr:hypothetical protein [Phycicoccus sp. HDW14]QIM21423.1 hypothetical protein G7075_10300 [Phycicoccus sp. HDW14]
MDRHARRLLGAERNREALDVLSGSATDVPAVAGATCAVLSAADVPTGRLAAALDADPAWRAAGSVPGLGVWVRR